MYLENIVLSNFRALKQEKFEFSKEFNIIYGKNAQGKTSIIEAIYFLATGKSFRTRKTVEQINYNEKRTTVFGKTNYDSYSIELLKDKKNFYINKEKTVYSKYIGSLLAVSFSPEDMQLINDTPDYRRRFFNYEIAQTDMVYLKKILDFQKVLKVRNKLLKEGDTKSPVFDIYNKKYVELSVYIYEKRKEYIKKLSDLIAIKYEQLFGNQKKIEIRYEAFLNFNEKDKYKEFNEQLKSRLEKEKIMGYSLLGPQKDDFAFYIENKKVKSFASQGEKKSIIFSLKLAQIEYIIDKMKESPIFLLDDITAYFDEIRKTKVLEYIREKKIQCFFTSTEKIDIEAKLFNIFGGEQVWE